MASAKVMIHPPPRTALPPPPSYEEDDEDAFDYEQYSRTDNEDDGEEEMYSAQGSPFKGHERTRSRSIATANPFHVFDPPESTRFASPAPELSFVTTSTAESSARSVRGSGSGSGSVIGAAEGVMIRQASDYTPSPVDVIPADKSGIWDEVGRNRQRSGNRTSLSASGSGSGSASGSGASTPGYGLAPALPTGTVSSSATHLSRAHYSPLAMQRPSLTLRTSSYGHPSSTDDFANSPLSREISQLRIGSEGVQGRARSGTVSSRTSLSSMARPVEDVASQSDASRRNSLHRSVLDRNSIQQFELGAGCISRSTTALTADKWLESSDYDSDLDGVLSRNRAVGNETPATEWNHRYYGETSFQSETELEGNAVGLVEDGKSRIIDAERMTSWGGVTRVTERLRNESEGQFDGGIIEEFDGATHLLLSHVGLGEQVIDLLSVLLPVVASTLVVLDISNNLLLDLPPSLARCHSLEELNISENPVLVLPSWAGELINLRMVMADGCGLKTLPAELAKARMLHTICVRRNRMINLPSWLSQLCKLETLLIDDNPFAGYWQQMIGNILVQPLESIPPVPPVPFQFRRPSGASSPSLLSPVDSPYPPSSNPSLASIHSPRLRSLASPGLVHSPYHDASRHASEVTLSPSTTQPQSANSSGYFDSASAGPSRVASPPLPAIPDSARPKYPGLQPSRPAGQIKVPTRKPSRALKRMRSAGALLGLRMEEGYQHGAMSAGEMETLVSEPERYPRQGQPIPIQHDMSSDDEGPQRTVSDRPPTKTGKWGFLKKMSMSKMRAPAITRNPPSDPAKLQKHPVRIPKSASTMPTMRRLPEGGSVSEFGVNLPRETPSPALSATMPVKGSRTKRRSFLPILDAPPSLDIPIPTVSGFDASLAFANSPTVAQRMVEDASKSPLPERNNQESHGRSYDIGLKSIMSYLRDLYDLSLPIPVINAGAEIVHSDASGASGSVSATSEPRVGSPLASGRVLPTVGFRSRRPTIVANDMDDVAGDRSPVSITEINDQLQIARPNSVARQAPEEPVHQKEYKDDSGVRTGVIRHILDTERSYVQGLRELVDIYVRPASLLVKGSIETVIPQTERKIVFGGIEGILRFHEVSFLPTLETAAKDLLRAGDDATGERSKRVARALGEAFQTYHPFMRQYSTYINNFDFALSRLASWATIHDKFTSGTAAGGVGLGISTSEANNSQLTPAQRKRVKHFLKACRKNPKHTQINLESYLLLPVQRIPRYRMLLDSLARSTPPSIDVSLDPIEAALEEMVALASTMNEEKRDAESRQRLVKWQSRIRGRFASPLVQAHRRLLLDGSLLLTRIVKRSSTFVEVSSSLVDDNGNNENTITNAKTIVQIEALAPEVPNRQLAAIVTSDLMILCKDPAMGKDPNSQLDLYAVLKMQTKRKPAMLLQGSGIRLVDNKAILYLSASSHQEAANWVRIINNEFDPLR